MGLDLDSNCSAFSKHVFFPPIGRFFSVIPSSWPRGQTKWIFEDFFLKVILKTIKVLLRKNTVITGTYMIVYGTNIDIVGKLSTY